nr:MAG TPA: hypothetical protein [Caudoviricetes sp.]
MYLIVLVFITRRISFYYELRLELKYLEKISFTPNTFE